MTSKPADIDPPELHERLWWGFDGGLGYDVGANYGQSIEIMLARFNRVVAFEPSPGPYRHLEEHWGDSQMVILRDHAVSSDVGEVQAFELDDGQYAYPGTHGITELTGPRVHTARCRDLDSITAELKVPDFIKVDTEGHEGHVMLGARRLIARYRPDWLIEFHTEELRFLCLGILETLGSGGYEIETVRHPHYPEGSDNWRNHGWIRALDRN